MEMDSFLEAITAVAVEELHESQGLPAPLVFSLTDDALPDMVVVPVDDFETQDEKFAAFTLAIGIARALGTPRLVTLVDCWYAEEDRHDLTPSVMPSQNPNRKEGLMINDSTEIGINTWILKYTRDDDGNVVVDGEWEHVDATAETGVIHDLLDRFSHSTEVTPNVREGARQFAAMKGIL